VGVERTTPGGDTGLQSLEAEGSVWRFYHLLYRARVTGGTFTWVFGAPVPFDITPDPWSIVVPSWNHCKRRPGSAAF
jgi:hypothetical protein